MPETLTNDCAKTQVCAADWSNQGRREVDIISCEYPPSVGGVGDYTFSVAAKLEERGCVVRVWTAGDKRADDTLSEPKVMRTFDGFGLRDLFRHDRLLGSAKGRRLFLQWEPVGFGWQSLNLPFCVWMATRAWRGTTLLVMFHETFLPFNKRSLKRYFAGSVQRLMALTLVNSAAAVFASTGSGALSLQSLCVRPEKVRHLPVFSNIENRGGQRDEVLAVRQDYVRAGEALVGHFGRFMANTEPLVIPALGALLARDGAVKILFIGECGPRYRAALLARDPSFSARVFASGVRPQEELAQLIAACDLMFQPYPGGITTKRSSTMASLALGRCVLSNRGPETEGLWSECAGLRMAKTSEPEELAAELVQLTATGPELAARGAAGAAFYQTHFSLEHTVDAVLSSLGSWDEAMAASSAP